MLGAAGFAAMDGAGGAHAGGVEPAESPEPIRSTPPPPSPDASTSSPGPDIPSTGPGTFTTAAGSSAQAGSGTALRYRVEVEDGLDLPAADVARQVERILADPRGWTADGRSAFQRVPSGPADFVVRLATPGTVDTICGQYGLDTGGEYNCNVAQNVMVNLERRLPATPVYAKDVTAYRVLIINHEVGHFLGHGHPYDAKGRYLTGPTVP